MVVGGGDGGCLERGLLGRLAGYWLTGWFAGGRGPNGERGMARMGQMEGWEAKCCLQLQLRSLRLSVSLYGDVSRTMRL